MRILGAIVEPAADLLAIGVADISHLRRVIAEPFGHELRLSAVFLHDALGYNLPPPPCFVLR